MPELTSSQHYEFYHFLVNSIPGFDGPVFNWSAQPTKATSTVRHSEEEINIDEYDPLNPKKNKDKDSGFLNEELEGFHDDPSATKVVDRRWYEKNKHIFPASVWEEYSPDKAFTKAGRKDAEGNMFFFT